MLRVPESRIRLSAEKHLTECRTRGPSSLGKRDMPHRQGALPLEFTVKTCLNLASFPQITKGM